MAVITISRQYFSGGNEIADRVCALLRYRYFDKRLIAEVATETSGATGEPIDFTEEHYRMPSFLDRLLKRMPQHPAAASRGQTPEMIALDTEAAITLEQAAIKAAYELGKVVIAGRGGQVILRGKPGVLHVRIEAPLESRIQRLRQVADFTSYAAREEILDHDRASADYIKRFYGVNWSDSSLYHLIINSDLWGVAAAARLVVSAVEGLQFIAKPQ